GAEILEGSTDEVVEKLVEQQGDFKVTNMLFSQIRERVPRLLTSIENNVQRIKEIVNELKDFSRQMPPEMADGVDIKKAVKNSIGLVSNLIKKSTNCFSVHYDDDIPTIYANTRRIEQVIINLLVNACQALPNRQCGVTVTVSFNKESDTVNVEIIDEGIGIPPDVIDKIKDPFFTTKRNSGGTGLGLAISDRIIRDHYGSLVFLSTLGKGTTVRLILPRNIQAKYADSKVKHD
ncbi:MAG: histidine kinase, partial [Desulfobacterales bacterium]|nr:histidine kinase [Desulfobacterales bacterium]